MTDADIYTVLLEIKEDIGTIRSTTSATKDWLSQHVADDKIVAERVAKLEFANENQKGRASVWSIVGATVGSVVGAIAAHMGSSR